MSSENPFNNPPPQENAEDSEALRERLLEIYRERFRLARPSADEAETKEKLAAGVNPEEIRRADKEKMDKLYYELSDLIKDLPLNLVMEVENQALNELREASQKRST